MNKKTILTLILTCCLVLCGFSQDAYEFSVPKAGTVNVGEISKNKTKWFTTLKKAHKHKSDQLKSNNPVKNDHRTRIDRQAPTLPSSAISIGTSFAVPESSFGNPPDNEIAIGNDGKIVTISNGALIVYDADGTVLASTDWATWTESVTDNYFLFDPRIIYDPIRDRYVVLVLNGTAGSFEEEPNYDSRIILGFSETNDPAGNYNLYTIELENHPESEKGRFFDYYSMGISANSLYASENTSRFGYALKASLSDGFSGASSISASYSTFTPDEGTDRREIFFVQNHDMNQSDHVYGLFTIVSTDYDTWEDLLDIGLIKYNDHSNMLEHIPLKIPAQYLEKHAYPTQPNPTVLLFQWVKFTYLGLFIITN